MKTKIMILSALAWEKEGKSGSRIDFILCDKDDFVKGDKFKGYTPIAQFYNGMDAFNAIKPEMIGQPLDANLKTVKSFKNPLDTKQVVESVVYKDNVVTLLQSK